MSKNLKIGTLCSGYDWNRYEVHIRSTRVPNKKAYYVCNGFFKNAYAVAQECFTRFLNNE